MRSNIPPTESEISCVRDVITTTEIERLKEIGSSYHTGSARLTLKTLTNLNYVLDCTHRFIVEHKTILSPIVHTYDAFLPRSLKTYSFTHLESNVVNNVQQKQKRLTFGVDGSQVSVFKEGDKVSLGGFLESHHSRGLEAEIGLTSHEVSVSHKAMTSNDTP